MSQRSSTDELTGLPNRTFLYETGAQLLAESAVGRLAALFMLDLDDFKTVNDTLGHAAGDAALRQVAERLSSALGGDITVARLAGDEFVVLAPGLASPADADAIARRIGEALDAPLEWQEVSLHVEASVGMALYPRDGETIEALARVADEAMYVEKSATGLSGGGGPARSVPAGRARVSRDELAAGVRRQELLVHYQPQVDARTGHVVGFETLVRWQHPRLGLLEPRDFLGLADRSGLMGGLSRSVLRHALRDLAVLSAHVPGATISVNMTARSLLGRGLIGDIARLTAEHDVSPSRLVIEVNEPPARQSRSMAEIFEALHELGCQASVHDFGRGQVSLAVLSSYRAIREIKVAPALVARVDEPSATSMIRAIVGVAQALGLWTVAEGIESVHHAETLRGLGCDRLQGFHIAAPMALPALETWLAPAVGG